MPPWRAGLGEMDRGLAPPARVRLALETPARCTVYRRRRPERTPLYRAVQGHLETYLALARDGHTFGDSVP